MNKKRLIIYIVVYALIVVSLLVYFNHKRSSEYLYSYDLSTFKLDAGSLTDDGAIMIDEASGFDGVFANSTYGQYRNANYTMVINYSCDNSQQVHLCANSNLDIYVSLPAEQNEIPIDFVVWPSSDMFSVKFSYNGAGSFRINSIIITADKPLYLDYEYYMILTILLGMLIPVGVWYAVKKRHFGKNDWTIVGVLGLAGIVINYPVVTRGYLWLGIDMRPHLMRIDGVAKAIEARFFPTIIYSNYCNDYGELSCIYPDKFLYLAGFMRNRGVSLLSTYLTAHVVINFAALIIMYFCAKYVSKSKQAAVISAVIYCFITYRVYVMYCGAQSFGNGLAMLFFPIVFVALYDILFLEGKKWYLLSIGVAGIMCSHVLSTVLCIIVCAMTFVFGEILLIVMKSPRLKPDGQKRIFIDLTKAIGAFLVICLSTLVPFVYYFSQGLTISKMSLRFMDSFGNLKETLLSIDVLYYYLLIVFVIVLIVLAKKCFGNAGDDESSLFYKTYCWFLLIVGFMFFIMTTKLFPWGVFIKIPFVEKGLNMLQFAERFNLAGSSAICLGIAMLLGLVLKACFVADNEGNVRVAEDAPFKMWFRVGVIALMVILSGISCKNIQGQLDWCGSLVPDRMSGNIYYRQFGYLPAGTDISFYESAVPNCGDWNSVENLSYIKNGTAIHYEYTCSSDNNYMEFPLFNYKGYHAYDGAGNELDIINSEHNRILVNLTKSDEMQVIDIKFIVHPIFTICGIISLLSLVGLIAYILWINLKKEPEREN